MPQRLLDFTRHADHLIRKCEAPIKAILDGMTYDDPFVGALFDCSDDEAMAIYRELGLKGYDGRRDGVQLMDLRQAPLLDVLAGRNLVPIDELAVREPGTVLLYVLTMGAVAARRFKTFVQPIAKLREVKLTRDTELPRTGLALEGMAALEVIVQMAVPTLRQLVDAKADRVGWIEKVSHGAKVGTISRVEAASFARSLAASAPPSERDRLGQMADSLDGSRRKEMPCFVRGWPGIELVNLSLAPVPASAVRDFGDDEARELHGYTVACRDRERALAILRKCLDKAASTPEAAPLAELIAFASEHWEDCDGILERIVTSLGAGSAADAVVEPGRRRRAVLTALDQATRERKRGGAINARGGAG